MIAPQPASAWESGKIGIFDLPESVYRPAAGVNQSILRHILRSPAHAKAELDAPTEPTANMVMGTLAHLACLEPAKFGEGMSHYAKPSDMSFATKDGKAWREAHQDKPIVSEEDNANLLGMRAAVATHPIAGTVGSRGVSEACVFANHEDTGLLMKGKLDKIFADGNGEVWIADLKKVQDCREFGRHAYSFRYDMQAAFYLGLLTAVGLEVKGFMFLTVEEKPPHGVQCFVPDPEFLRSGRAAVDRAMSLWLECSASGEWPNYAPELQSLSLPAWANK